MTIICSKCGCSLAADVRFCSQCGTPISSYYANSGASPHEPTAQVAPFQTPAQIPSTDYGANPYEIPLQNPYELPNPYEAPLRPPPPPSRRRSAKIALLVGLGMLILLLVSGSIFALLSQRVKNNSTNGLPTSTISLVTPTPASTPTPKFTSVSPITPAQYQTIIITGNGFGTQQPFTNTTSNYINLQDISGQWRAGYGNDGVGVTISAWTDNQIEITGFSNYGGGTTFRLGEEVFIAVWNPQTHAGPALFTTTVAH